MHLSLFTLATGLIAAVSGQKVKVMLMGDSITEITCWRPMVWSQLASAGLTGNITLVGSMTDTDASCSKPTGFDSHHEGHSGWQAYDIARNNIAGWAQTSKPDVVQFMLGTNDVNIGKRNAQSILDSYSSIVKSLRAVNPKVKIIIDKMIPTSWSDTTVEGVNTAIPNWASQQSTSQSPIVVADCSRAAGFTNAMLRGDGVHPNAQGDQFIAKQVGPKLIQAIKDAVSGSSPTPTSVATTLSTAIATSSAPTSTSAPPADCAAQWGQCGGQGWTGATCCAQGSCKVSNDYYSQCQ